MPLLVSIYLLHVITLFQRYDDMIRVNGKWYTKINLGDTGLNTIKERPITCQKRKHFHPFSTIKFYLIVLKVHCFSKSKSTIAFAPTSLPITNNSKGGCVLVELWPMVVGAVGVGHLIRWWGCWDRSCCWDVFSCYE